MSVERKATCDTRKSLTALLTKAIPQQENVLECLDSHIVLIETNALVAHQYLLKVSQTLNNSKIIIKALCE